MTRAPHFQLNQLPKKIQQQLIANKIVCTATKSVAPKPTDTADVLFRAMVLDPEFDHSGWERERKDIVPGRKYRADIAHKKLRIVIEVHGWGPGHQGKQQGGYSADLEKANRSQLNGWLYLQFSSSDVRQRLDYVFDIIRQAQLRRNICQ